MKSAVRLYLVLYALSVFLAFQTTGNVAAEQYASCAILASMMFPIAFLPFALWRMVFRLKDTGSGLDRVLFRFPTGDPFYLRHLLTSICVFGIIGAGKSSSSGLFFSRLILRINSGGLILASKPTDVKWWSKRFAEAGRSDDLIVFSKTSQERWNFLARLQAQGGDAREVTDFLIVASETLVASKGKEEIFWKTLAERLLFNVVSALMLAGAQVSIINIINFLTSAAYSPEQYQSEAFKKGYCNDILTLAKARSIDHVTRGDFALVETYWRRTFVLMEPKQRGTAQNQVDNILHCLSVGYAREIFSNGTTKSCDDMASGKFLLLDFCVSEGGPTSRLIYSLAKLSTEKMVLKNHWTPDQAVTVIWADEASHVLNSGDREALKEFRKHGGVLIFLTQTILDYFVAMGEEGKAKAEGLLGLFGLRVFHAADHATAKHAVELMGEQETDEIGGSFTPSPELIDRMGGRSSWTGSFNRRRLPIMTGRQLTAGLRMGGKSKVVDAWVYRPELFATGSNIQLMQFHQED